VHSPALNVPLNHAMSTATVPALHGNHHVARFTADRACCGKIGNDLHVPLGVWFVVCFVWVAHVVSTKKVFGECEDIN
jgi:hypothetical protein